MKYKFYSNYYNYTHYLMLDLTTQKDKDFYNKYDNMRKGNLKLWEISEVK